MDEPRRRAWISWAVLLAIALAVAIMVLTMMRPGPAGGSDGMLPTGHAPSRPMPRPA